MAEVNLTEYCTMTYNTENKHKKKVSHYTHSTHAAKEFVAIFIFAQKVISYTSLSRTFKEKFSPVFNTVFCTWSNYKQTHTHKNKLYLKSIH